MRKVVVNEFGDPSVLTIQDVPVPEPGVGEVRLAVRAVGINPVDTFVRSGAARLLGDPPVSVGWDVAGVVDAVGPDVRGLAVGDRVFGMPRFPAEAGVTADFAVVPAVDLARTPDDLDDVHAAALPLVTLTAHQALIERAGLQPGQRVLVQAAGGGVGHVAVQLAAAHGAEVVGTASSDKIDFVLGLGAGLVVDYATDSPTGPFDVIIDPFGGENSRQVLPLVRPGGVLAVLYGDVADELRTAADERGVRVERISVTPNAAALEETRRLAAQGRLQPFVSTTFPLTETDRAHALVETGHVQGKVVVVI